MAACWTCLKIRFCRRWILGPVCASPAVVRFFPPSWGPCDAAFYCEARKLISLVLGLFTYSTYCSTALHGSIFLFCPCSISVNPPPPYLWHWLTCVGFPVIFHWGPVDKSAEGWKVGVSQQMVALKEGGLHWKFSKLEAILLGLWRQKRERGRWMEGRGMSVSIGQGGSCSSQGWKHSSVDALETGTFIFHTEPNSKHFALADASALMLQHFFLPWLNLSSVLNWAGLARLTDLRQVQPPWGKGTFVLGKLRPPHGVPQICAC